MQRTHKRRHLSERIFVLQSCIALLLFAALGIGVYTIAFGFMRQDAENTAAYMAERVAREIEAEADGMSSLLLALVYEPELKAFASEFSPENQVNRARFLSRADMLASTHRYLDYYIFIGQSGYMWSSASPQSSVDFRSLIGESDWIHAIDASEDALVPITDFSLPKPDRSDSGTASAYALAYRLQPPFSSGSFALVSLHSGFFAELGRTLALEADEACIIQDADGHVIHTFGATTEERMEVIGGTRAPQSLSAAIATRKSGWTVTQFPSVNRMHMQMSRLMWIVIATVGGALALLTACSWAATRWATRSLVKLTRWAESAAELNYVMPRNEWRDAEVGELAERFEALVRELMRTQVFRREAEIEALHQQINPHFLYNTLEVINALALGRGAEDIAEISQSLGSMLRYSIAPLGTLSSLKQELAHVEDYLSIMKKRYRDRFSVRFQIDSGLENTIVPRLTLQPLVENAIHHGLRDCLQGGLIEISAHREGDGSVVEVRDNGCGMDAEPLQALREKLMEDGLVQGDMPAHGIGLVNVNRRLRIGLGEPCGLELVSDMQDDGFCVRVHLF